MALLHCMRHDDQFSERYCYIASDGWAYERPRGARVRRYAHDGGTQTMASAREDCTKEQLGETLWKEIWRAFLSNKE